MKYSSNDLMVVKLVDFANQKETYKIYSKISSSYLTKDASSIVKKEFERTELADLITDENNTFSRRTYKGVLDNTETLELTTTSTKNENSSGMSYRARVINPNYIISDRKLIYSIDGLERKTYESYILDSFESEYNKVGILVIPIKELINDREEFTMEEIKAIETDLNNGIDLSYRGKRLL